MKKTLAYILIGALLILLIPGILLVCELSLPDIYGETYYAELAAMTERLYNTEGRKLIVVGGSSVAFGLDGDLLEELLSQGGLEVTVCPYGLYAAVGTSAMLSLSEDALGEGDIVVFAFEPSEEALTTYFGATAFLKCAEASPSMFFRLGSDQQKAAVGNYVPYLQERIACVRSGELPSAQGAYRKDAFNENCTMTFDRPGNVMTIGYDTADPVKLDGLAPSDDFVKQVNEYIRKAEKRGAECFMSFAPVNLSALDPASEETEERYFEVWNEAFACRTISDPSSYILESGWFYDSNFHLNSAGARLRTILLAGDILAEYGVNSAPYCQLPSMPETEETPAETDGNALLVSGLTGSGLSAVSLTVPAYSEGLPVVGLTETALSGAELLEELRLPATVEKLSARQFAGCPSLKRVILERTQSPVDLDPEALKGADGVRFFVPEAVFPMYRDGWGCETNPWEDYVGRIYSY